MIQKKKFKISGMHCTSCSLSIDWELEETEGVKKVSTSYAKQQTEVTYDSNVITPRKIVAIIKKKGYETTSIEPT